ncbi:MAG: hypothetical protein ABSF78_14275, partial [Candidatus Acidiferrales bacterium]
MPRIISQLGSNPSPNLVENYSPGGYRRGEEWGRNFFAAPRCLCFGNWPDLADFADFADLVGLVNFVDFANLENFANFGGFAGRLGGRSAGAVSLP